MKKKYQNIFFVFGLAVLALMITQLDFAQVWSGLSRAGYWFVAVIALWFFLYMFNTASWYVIINNAGQDGENIRKKVGFWWLYKITVSGFALNPHAGDHGVMGDEEQTVISPAIDELADSGIQAFGPYPADGFFGSGQYNKFDAVLAMYHDQGLAPFKTLAVEDGVNYTAGLPIIRTSPDHGTAYDIAGTGVADENSFRQAIFMAIDIFRNRANYDEPFANPLPKLYHEKKDDSEKVRFNIPKPKDQFK